MYEAQKPTHGFLETATLVLLSFFCFSPVFHPYSFVVFWTHQVPSSYSYSLNKLFKTYTHTQWARYIVDISVEIGTVVPFRCRAKNTRRTGVTFELILIFITCTIFKIRLLLRSHVRRLLCRLFSSSFEWVRDREIKRSSSLLFSAYTHEMVTYCSWLQCVMNVNEPPKNEIIQGGKRSLCLIVHDTQKK